MLRLSIFLLFLGVVANAGEIHRGYTFRDSKCAQNQKINKMVVHKNKTVDFQCTNILCDDVVLKFDDEKKCTKLSKSNSTDCPTMSLVSGIQVKRHYSFIQLGKEYEGNVYFNASTGLDSDYYYINSYSVSDMSGQIFVWIDQLSCNSGNASNLMGKIDEIMAQKINEQAPVYSLQSLWQWFKERFYYLRPQEKILVLNLKQLDQNSTHLISVNQNATILEIKQVIEELTNYPVDQQKLLLKDQILDDSSTTSNYSIESDTILDVEFLEKLFVMNSIGQKAPIIVAKTCNFNELSTAVQQVLDICTDKQQVYFDGTLLTADNFNICDIQNGSTLLVNQVAPSKIYIEYKNKLMSVELTDENLTVDHLKSKAKENWNLSENLQDIVFIKFNDSKLDCNKKISDYGIKADSLVKIETCTRWYSNYYERYQGCY